MLFITESVPGQHDSGLRVYPHLLLSNLHARQPLAASLYVVREYEFAGILTRLSVLPDWACSCEIPWRKRIGPYSLGGRLGWHIARRPWDYFAAWSARHPDAPVVVNHTERAGWLDLVPPRHRGTRIVITHDVVHRRVDAYRDAGKTPDFTVMSAAEERSLLQRADIVVAINEDDRAALAALLPSTEVVCLPPPICPAPQDESRQIAGKCLFVGGPAQSNVAGLSWFLEQCWPRVRERFPTATLDVCGTVSKRLPAPPDGVTHHGAVDDLSAHYATSSVCLVPLLFGSGLKLKLIEAMAHGRPVVSTRVGLQGLGPVEKTGVACADLPDAFADHVVTLLTTPEVRRQQVARQFELLNRQLNPETINNSLMACLRPRRVGHETVI